MKEISNNNDENEFDDKKLFNELMPTMVNKSLLVVGQKIK